MAEHTKDITEAVSLFDKVFGAEILPENYIYKHFSNPFRLDSPVIYQQLNGKVIGMYGCMRQEIQQNGHIFWGIYCCDVAIDPEHKNGVYFRLLSDVLERCQNLASFIVMQRPSPVHGYILNSIGFHDAGKVCTMILKIADVSLPNTLLLNTKTAITRFCPFDAKDFKDIENSIHTGIHRSAEYYKWKVDFNVFRNMSYCTLRTNGKLTGYFVFEIDGKVLRIVDWILTKPGDGAAFQTLLKYCIHTYQELEYVKIKCVNTQSLEQDMLQRLNFSVEKYQNIYWLALNDKKNKLTLADWTMRELDEDGLLQNLKKHDTRYYFISPHYDDAVGACGALINDLVMQGKDVTIVTVFGGIYKGELSEYGRKLHSKWGITDNRQRDKEDQEACKVLACKRKALTFLDAIYRQVPAGHFLYDSADSLFADIHKDDMPLIEEIIKFFNEQFRINDRYYFPIGLGGHIDHRIVNHVGNELAKKGYNIAYYREFFYKDFKNQMEGCSVYRISDSALIKKHKAVMKYRSQLPTLYDEDREEVLLEYLRKEEFNEQIGSCTEFYRYI